MDSDTAMLLLKSSECGTSERYRLACPHGCMELVAPSGCDGKSIIDALVLGHSAQYGGCDCGRQFVARFGIPEWLAEPPEDAAEREQVLAILAGDQVAIATARAEQVRERKEAGNE